MQWTAQLRREVVTKLGDKEDWPSYSHPLSEGIADAIAVPSQSLAAIARDSKADRRRKRSQQYILRLLNKRVLLERESGEIFERECNNQTSGRARVVCDTSRRMENVRQKDTRASILRREKYGT